MTHLYHSFEDEQIYRKHNWSTLTTEEAETEIITLPAHKITHDFLAYLWKIGFTPEETNRMYLVNRGFQEFDSTDADGAGYYVVEVLADLEADARVFQAKHIHFLNQS